MAVAIRHPPPLDEGSVLGSSGTHWLLFSIVPLPHTIMLVVSGDDFTDSVYFDPEGVLVWVVIGDVIFGMDS